MATYDEGGTVQSVRSNDDSGEPRDNADGEIIAYCLGLAPIRLCRASSQRLWMDQSLARFAYRCLPLVIANQLGWDLLNPIPFQARWLGGPAPADVQIETLDDSAPAVAAIAHFGEGVLTFDVGHLFRTPPGVRLLVTGPLNAPKPGLYPLSGVVETDWAYASFTMNYKFTEVGKWVTFERDEAFCRIVPISLAPVEGLQGRVRALSSDPKLEALYGGWSQERVGFIRQLHNPFSESRRRGWQKEYFQGQGADGRRQEGHQTKLNHREFIDERSDHHPPEKQAARPKKNVPLPPSAATQATAHDFLWRSSRPFENRWRKSVQVMSAIAQTLERTLALDGGEQSFLASYGRFAQASSEAFTQVCLEPRAYFWVRIGFQLIDAFLNGRNLSPLAQDYQRALGAADVRQALSAHLDRFAEFELAAAKLDGRAWDGLVALTAPEPWSMPASPWTIESRAAASVGALRGGELSGRQEERPWQLRLGAPHVDQEHSAPRLSECPVLRIGVCSIRLQPGALAGLGVSSVQPALTAGAGYQAQHACLVSGALEAIRRYTPEVFEQIRDNVRLIALKPVRNGTYTNVSLSELPGAMLLTVIDHPLVMADRIIHEFHHHRLFSIEDGDPLLAPPTTAGQRLARYYSPWRDDPRPIRGILHGLYVYIAVGRYWLAVYEAEDRPPDRPYVIDQLVRIGKQLSLAREVLASHARFTPIGEGAFEQLTADVAALHERMQKLGLPSDTPALLVTEDGEIRPQQGAGSHRSLTVAEAIEEHMVRFDR